MKNNSKQSRGVVLPTWQSLLSRLYLLPEGSNNPTSLKLEVLSLFSNPSTGIDALLQRLCVILPKITSINGVAIFRLQAELRELEYSSLSNQTILKITNSSLVNRQITVNRGKSRIPAETKKSLSRNFNFLYNEPLGDIDSSKLVLLTFSPTALPSDQLQLVQVISQLVRLRLEKEKLKNLIDKQSVQMKTLTHHLAEGMIVFDSELRIQLWGKPMETFSGYGEKEAIGKRIDEILQTLKVSPSTLEIIQKSIDNPKTSRISIDLEIKCRNNIGKWINFSGSILRDKSGKVDQIIIVVHNISRAKALEQQKNEFISIATHELRTPLTVIKGYLSLITKESKNFTERQKHYLKRATEAGDRLVHLAEELLKTVQIEQDRVQFLSEKIDLYQLLKKIVRDLKTRANQKGLLLTITKPNFPSEILLDPERTEQIFTNIVDNAIKYTQRGSIKVSFELSKRREIDPEYLMVNIRDTGIGIPGDKIEVIFEKFQRAHRPELVQEQGAGLGLFIVKSFIDKQGGKILVRSRPGHGTIISVLFPLVSNLRSVKKVKNDR